MSTEQTVYRGLHYSARVAFEIVARFAITPYARPAEEDE